MTSQDLLAKEGFFSSSFHLPELIRCPAGSPGMEGGRVSSASIFLTFRPQFWDLEHRSQLPQCGQTEVQGSL